MVVEDVEHLRLVQTMQAFTVASDNALTIAIEVTDSKGYQQNLVALVDSGASGIFMNTLTAERMKLKQSLLQNPIRLLMADGTASADGCITKGINNHALTILNHVEQVSFLVTCIPGYDVVLGMSWLQKNNPIIDWVERSIKFPKSRLLATSNCI